MTNQSATTQVTHVRVGVEELVRALPDEGVPSPTYFVGGREYPMLTNPNCKVCTIDPVETRIYIEQQVVKTNGKWTMIANSIPPSLGVSRRNLYDHWHNGHMPVAVALRVGMAQRHALEAGLDIDDEITSLHDEFSFLHNVLEHVQEDVAEGRARFEPQHAVMAARALLDFKKKTEVGDLDASIHRDILIGLTQSMQEVLPPELRAALMDRLRSNPHVEVALRKYLAQPALPPKEEA